MMLIIACAVQNVEWIVPQMSSFRRDNECKMKVIIVK